MCYFVPRITGVLLMVVAGTLALAAAEDRQFSASGEGYVTYDHSNLFGGQLFAGGIEAMHLGHSFLDVSLRSDLLEYGLFIPYGGSLTSASGDELYFQFDERLYLFDPATGVFSATLTFMGGTGRFQDATGSAVVMFVFNTNYPIQHFDFLIDGSIDY